MEVDWPQDGGLHTQAHFATLHSLDTAAVKRMYYSIPVGELVTFATAEKHVDTGSA